MYSIGLLVRHDCALETGSLSSPRGSGCLDGDDLFDARPIDGVSVGPYVIQRRCSQKKKRRRYTARVIGGQMNFSGNTPGVQKYKGRDVDAARLRTMELDVAIDYVTYTRESQISRVSTIRVCVCMQLNPRFLLLSDTPTRVYYRSCGQPHIQTTFVTSE